VGTFEDHVLAFWEGVHKRGSVVHLGATTAQDYSDYFSKAGHFPADLAAASSVLDIGPGHFNYLNALAHKERHAVDVSALCRDKARTFGVEAYAPGEIGAGVADLATCLSVIQHCEVGAVEVIFADTARALRKGGRFYLNGIHGGHHTPSPEGLLSGGRCSHSLDCMREIAERHGFAVNGEHFYRAGALGIWILCLEKL
jgi:SAM-dependent methyltransferase